MDELRTMLEQTTADFISNLFTRPRDDNLNYIGHSEDTLSRLRPQKSTRSLKTINSTKSNERKHDIKRLQRRSNLSNLTDDSHIILGHYNDNAETMNADSGEGSFRKFKERVRVAESPRESAFTSARPPSPQTYRKNTITSEPIDIPEKSRPNLSINTTGFTGSPRKNAFHSHFIPQTQSPATPSDYTFTKKKHESVAASSYESHSPYISLSRKLAQVIIIEDLTDANEVIYAFIMEEEIDELSRRMDQVTVHNDMQRYMRDVVVGLRTHRLVKGGLTARASSDLGTLVKALAAIFQRKYATPELVLFASEKVFSHRLILRDVKDDKSIMYGTNLTTLLRARKLAPKIPTPGDVVADVLQAVWPPV
ncbi:4950_t:CDS:2 [Acaulospora colombiana]|uniref:4950_t:CDS:1 n=1 Tax=Acaulospora colombiana TaxID=27376 RepID=A0ACA9LSL7_9GLOM|nr:4950_t:CDS:2 [Acaulospora colombiana]